jgi:hypothetical protein
MEPWQMAEIEKLEKTGYMNALRLLVRSHTCPIWWYENGKSSGDAILHNGTITFVNTGGVVIGITACHVFHGYMADKKSNPAVKCQIGNATAEPERYLISADVDSDLATFQLPLVLLAACGVTVHNAPTWPPRKLQVSDLVILGGYPGQRREEVGAIAKFDFVSFATRITECSDDHASVYVDTPNSFWPQGENLGPEPDLGGASGGPVFRLQTAPIETLEYAGMIYESSQGYELIFARHLNGIAATGAIHSS